MKKESLKQILIVIGAVALISLIFGIVSQIAFFDAFAHYGQDVSNIELGKTSYNELKPYFLSCFIINIIILVLFISFIFLSLIKSKKIKKILALIILISIISLSIASCIIARSAINPAWNRMIRYKAEFPSSDDDISYSTYLRYENNLANVLNVSVSAIILAAALMILLIINNKEEKKQKEIETQQNNNSSDLTTAE